MRSSTMESDEKSTTGTIKPTTPVAQLGRNLHQRTALPLRIVQAGLAMLVMGLLAYVATVYNNNELNYGPNIRLQSSPGEVNFLLLMAAWTLLLAVGSLAVIFIGPAAWLRFLYANNNIRPRSMTAMIAVLSVEATTAILWFAGFVALASYGTSDVVVWSGLGRQTYAAVVFAGMEFIFFGITTVFQGLHFFRRPRSVAAEPTLSISVDYNDH